MFNNEFHAIKITKIKLMKNLILLSVIALSLYSCKNNNNAASTASPAPDTSAAPVALKSSELDGLWTGAFTASPEDEALQKKARDFEAAYFKKLNGVDEEEYEGENYITEIKVIPAELRKAYFMEPLDGYYSLKSLNKVSLIIEGINASGDLIGRSICAGNERPVTGTFTETNEGLKAELKEPATA